MPFANIGGGAEQEHFVDGVTESLTTDLSRIRGAYRSSPAIRRSPTKASRSTRRRIGRELNVRYVLEGSVQRGGNRMRVNVQLINSETGNHLWAELLDKPLADLFDMQDEIVARLAGALEAQTLSPPRRDGRNRPQTPNSMDLYFQAMAWFNKGVNPDDVRKGARLFRPRARRRSRQRRRGR